MCSLVIFFFGRQKRWWTLTFSMGNICSWFVNGHKVIIVFMVDMVQFNFYGSKQLIVFLPQINCSQHDFWPVQWEDFWVCAQVMFVDLSIFTEPYCSLRFFEGFLPILINAEIYIFVLSSEISKRNSLIYIQAV